MSNPIVVPANAGTHTARSRCLGMVGEAFCYPLTPGVMGPRLRGDDVRKYRNSFAHRRIRWISAFSKEEVAFRDEVRAFFKDHVPPATRLKLQEGRHLSKQEMIDWWRILNKKGWGVSHWPKEYGGTGWSSVQHYIFNEELQMAPAPSPLAFGVSMVGPVIYTFGNEQQKKRYLPRIANVDDWWCQGFSEPGSGSDLASLKTKPSARATSMSSTARRPGPRWRSTPTGSSACAAPIPAPRSSPAFRSS